MCVCIRVICSSVGDDGHALCQGGRGRRTLHTFDRPRGTDGKTEEIALAWAEHRKCDGPIGGRNRFHGLSHTETNGLQQRN